MVNSPASTTIAFDHTTDAGMANYMVKAASSLTYRQFCILSLAMNPARTGLARTIREAA
jgi:hypothetical protein